MAEYWMGLGEYKKAIDEMSKAITGWNEEVDESYDAYAIVGGRCVPMRTPEWGCMIRLLRTLMWLCSWRHPFHTSTDAAR